MPIENGNLCCAGLAAVRAAVLVSVSGAVLGVEESVPGVEIPILLGVGHGIGLHV